jgi:hypothetical protein
MTYSPGLALNLNPPDLCILSSQDYRREPPMPSPLFTFKGEICFLSQSLTVAQAGLKLTILLPHPPRVMLHIFYGRYIEF